MDTRGDANKDLGGALTLDRTIRPFNKNHKQTAQVEMHTHKLEYSYVPKVTQEKKIQSSMLRRRLRAKCTPSTTIKANSVEDAVTGYALAKSSRNQKSIAFVSRLALFACARSLERFFSFSARNFRNRMSERLSMDACLESDSAEA